MSELTVGSTIWIFDQNRRVYTKALPGKIWSSDGPIYREHWVPTTITGETSRSWIVSYGRKIPKKGPRPGVAFTQQEIEDDVWIKEHRYRIANEIQRIRDAETLRAIANLIGYNPE